MRSVASTGVQSLRGAANDSTSKTAGRPSVLNDDVDDEIEYERTALGGSIRAKVRLLATS